IVGGVPAKTIKKRFDDETINKLLESKWWLMSPNELKSKNFSLTNLKVSRE
ncbi:MAG: antibiotic acetyltransferase, partial [Staphylococcus sp.]|nr:antibiotic acetyltransferase [Staphylococcus sp.]